MSIFNFQRLRNKILICIVVWLGFASIGGAAGLALMDWRKYSRLSDGVGVWGRVTVKEPENHQLIRYSFIVGSQTYAGVGSAGQGNPPFGNLNVGDKVIVFYDPANPNVSCLGYPQGRLKTEVAGIVFLVIFLPVFPLGMAIILMIVISKSTAPYNNSFNRSAG
jgi:hypothetical protein